MKLKGIKGGASPTKKKPSEPKEKFDVNEYRKKPHVLTCDELTNDMYPVLADRAKNFAKQLVETEVMRKGHVLGISGRRDVEYGVVIANFDSFDMIAPVAFARNEDALEFSKYVYRMYLRYSEMTMGTVLDVLDPGHNMCHELVKVSEGLTLMLKQDQEKNVLNEKWFSVQDAPKEESTI